jgi:hypothetical protein
MSTIIVTNLKGRTREQVLRQYSEQGLTVIFDIKR